MKSRYNQATGEHVLLVYNEIPERYRIFQLMVDSADYEMLKANQDLYINGNGEEEFTKYNELVNFLDELPSERCIYDSEEKGQQSVYLSDACQMIVIGFFA